MTDLDALEQAARALLDLADNRQMPDNARPAVTLGELRAAFKIAAVREADALREERDRLRAQLGQFGVHLRGCPARAADNTPDFKAGPCGCGLSAALSPTEPAEKISREQWDELARPRHE